MKPAQLVAIAMIGALLVACGREPPPEATAHQDVWHGQDVSSYDFVYHQSAMAGTCELLVHVRGNRVASATVRHRCIWLDPKNAPTIDGVFAKLRAAYRDSDKVTAAYDGRYGFPTSVSVDVDRNAIDDEWGFGISDFVPQGVSAS